jgi:hypothetical protein
MAKKPPRSSFKRTAKKSLPKAGASAELLRDAFVLGWSAPDCAQAFVHGLGMLQAADARAKGRLQ